MKANVSSVLSPRKVERPVQYFVMNSHDEIFQALEDFRTGRLA